MSEARWIKHKLLNGWAISYGQPSEQPIIEITPKGEVKNSITSKILFILPKD